MRPVILKRLAGAAFISLMLSAPAFATTYYVDATCPTAGSGTSITCGGSGPKITLTDGIALLTTAGDILNIRGIHAAHGTCPGDTIGRYAADRWTVTKTGSVGNVITIQGNGYTSPSVLGEIGRAHV